MKIKRTSWHYKISNLGSGWEKSSDSLCLYFWRLVVKVVLLAIIGFIILWLVYGYFTDPFWISNTIVIVSVMLALVLPTIAVYYLRMEMGKSIKLPGEDFITGHIETGGNIIIEYIKAKKKKICPIIEYID